MPLKIHTFGPIRVTSGGQDVELPSSRKTRALLGFLAISGSPKRRDRLCEYFWEIPDDPRGALRWSLSKIRQVIDDDDTTRLIADRERVQLDLDHLSVDFHDVETLAYDDTATVEDLEDAWDLARTVLLDDCEIANQPLFESWLVRQRDEAARLRVRIARRLSMRSDLSPEDVDRWAERWFEDAQFDDAAARQLVNSRKKLGRLQEARDLQQDITRAFNEAGLTIPDWETAAEPAAELSAETPEPADTPSAPRQSVRFLQSSDNVAIAWASVGEANNPPLVKAANWLSHLELDWEAPIWSPLFRELAQTHNFIRYDERGCGLSDWDVPEISFETFVSDLELVVDEAGVERFPLLGISQGAAVSIEFAARYPERVSHLILFGSYACGWRHTATPEEVKEREAVMVLTESGWGRANPSYRHLFSRTFMPDASADELAWFDEFQRHTTSSENAVRFLEAFANIDVRHRLKDIKVPTLVIHCRGDLRIPISSSQKLAAQIPNAEFLSLPSNNHLLLGREPASREFIAAVLEFLKR